MADLAYTTGLPIQTSTALHRPAHPLIVRITHWAFALSFFGLVVSGIGILLSHPHFYWGETGGIGTPSLFDLPLPTMLGGPSGWGRSLHFLSAWLAVFTGIAYVASGILAQHFRYRLVPAPAQLSWNALRDSVAEHLRFSRPAGNGTYNILQRLSYLAVVFLVFPLNIVTGLAMSPVITSVFPQIVTLFGGHQSARTLHFLLANFLLLFLAVHVAMIVLAGFTSRVIAMITGNHTSGKGIE